MKQRKKKNNNKKSNLAPELESKPSETNEQLEVEKNGKNDDSKLAGETGSGTETGKSSASSSNEDVNAREASETPIDVDEKSSSVESSTEENSSSLAKSIEETSNQPEIKKDNMINSGKKVSELVTVRLPMHQVEQKPPLPPQSSSASLSHPKVKYVEKSQSMQINAGPAMGSDSRHKSQNAVFKSSSLKAFVTIPSAEELRREREALKTTFQKPQKAVGPEISASIHMVDKPTINPGIRQILVDLVTLQKMQEEINTRVEKPQQTAPLDRTVRQGGTAANHEEVVVTKKFKKVPPTPGNTKKLVAQVLKDLVQLYKADKTDALPKKKSPQHAPVVDPVSAAPPKADRQRPVEIKIRKVDDKIIIKSSEPVIINTTPDEVGKRVVESRLKTSASLDNCSPQQLVKGSSLGNLAPVISAGPKRVRYLGIVDADPEDYIRRYKNELCPSNKLPPIVKLVKTPNNIKLAAEVVQPNTYELEGDLEAFKHVNLEKVGMAEYKEFLNSKGIQSKPTASGCEVVRTDDDDPKLAGKIEGLFKVLDTNNDGLIESHDAERLLLKLNSTYGRSYGENESKAFFNFLAANTTDGNKKQLDLNTFKKAFGYVDL